MNCIDQKLDKQILYMHGITTNRRTMKVIRMCSECNQLSQHGNNTTQEVCG